MTLAVAGSLAVCTARQAATFGLPPHIALVNGVRNVLLGPVRVGIQIGHEAAADHPDELEALRWNFGGSYAGLDEVTINRIVTMQLTELLEARGVTVEVLPATVPVHYTADLMLSIHADSVLDESRNGYKSAHPEPPRNSREPLLKAVIDAAYLHASGLADDSSNTSMSMRDYYGFSGRFRHSVNPATPALLVELGYISNPRDRVWLQGPGPAAALADGITSYLETVHRLAPK